MTVRMEQRLCFTKAWQLLGWIMVSIVIWLSLTPKPPQPPQLFGWDKAHHFIAYAGLMYWYGMSFIRHWRWPVFLIALGVLMEILQGYSGYRSFDPFDMLANTLGVCFSLIILKTAAGHYLMAIDNSLAKRFRV